MSRKGENNYKRKDGRWEDRYIHHYVNGKAKYKSLYGNTYSEVKAKRQEELSKPEFLRTSAVRQLATLSEICALWLKDRKPDVKESTYQRLHQLHVVDRISGGFDAFLLAVRDNCVGAGCIITVKFNCRSRVQFSHIVNVVRCGTRAAKTEHILGIAAENGVDLFDILHIKRFNQAILHIIFFNDIAHIRKILVRKRAVNRNAEPYSAVC